MRTLLLSAGVAALALAAPSVVDAQAHGNGHGQSNQHDNPGDHGKGQSHDSGKSQSHAATDHGKPATHGNPHTSQSHGNAQMHGNASSHGNGNVGYATDHTEQQAHARADQAKQQQKADHGHSQWAGQSSDHGHATPSQAHASADQHGRAQNGQGQQGRAQNQHGKSGEQAQIRTYKNPDIQRQTVWKARSDVHYDSHNSRQYFGDRDVRRVDYVQGCPPGLAKKNNGCTPPGQAKKLRGYSNPYQNWYGYDRYRDSSDWRYSNGYFVRTQPTTNLITAFVPLLGGALYDGNSWPSSYSGYSVSPYYDSYYGYDSGNYDYRYADNAIFAVNPQTQNIQSIAGLLTGNDWTVGQAMPAGYDLYNVPPAYRSQYYDTPSEMYRYSDGYVYRVDPTTRLVQAAIQLLS
ncbi:hypothetical protein FHR23_001086 [Stakelama sediminis]|uniref:Nickel/cobalt transporter regulator n=1 Tax=Stakelama sediminis TaxID=463200 RepID=A0A840YXA5_9SPHN|nr:hypothetical protein [Stakelama sediminis]MBB5718179.1 hypothetical protein [Stakelama sediminis]